MNDKQQILTMLKDEFNRWEGLLSGLSEEQITARQLPSDLSVKDVMAHLWAWQQRSNARMDAALHGHDPVFPAWPQGLEDVPDGEPDQTNAWIHETNLNKPWSSVYRDWRDGFQRLIASAQAVPEEDLLEPGKYTWLGKHPLAEVLTATYEHHHVDHYEPLSEWLRQHEL